MMPRPGAARLVLLVFSLACSLAAADTQRAGTDAVSPAPDEALLTALLESFLEGASRNDPDAHRRFWDDDLVYTSSAGGRFGKAEILDSLESADEEPGPAVEYTAEEIRVRVYGDAATVAFRLVGTPRDGTAPNRYFNTGTFIRRAGGWRAVAWQATRIPPSD